MIMMMIVMATPAAVPVSPAAATELTAFGRLKGEEEEEEEGDYSDVDDVSGDGDASSCASSAADSRDDALCEMLGIASIDSIAIAAASASSVLDAGQGGAWYRFCGRQEDRRGSFQELVRRAAAASGFRAEYDRNGYAAFDASFSIPASFLREATERLVWGESNVQRTYERIGHQRCLTRLEQFCDDHHGDHRSREASACGWCGEWTSVADYAGACLSEALGTPMVLFKEKLNLKPPGGSGFAPHLDSPSLQQLDSGGGPTDFVTVMVAIDDMTSRNGCLRVSPGPWTRENAVATVLASGEGGGDRENPDGGGRRGLIPVDVADALQFVDVAVKGGTMVAFSGYTPHRSSVNGSCFARRAVFLTYNPAEQGDYRQAYYDRMKLLRNEYQVKQGFLLRDDDDDDDARAELEALRSIPRI
jgi:ectoine hydroxylase-related dioxygenase (phytanoyl-CoA dioxygenase family)